jgi:hypothetical protein
MVVLMRIHLGPRRDRSDQQGEQRQGGMSRGHRKTMRS